MKNKTNVLAVGLSLSALLLGAGQVNAAELVVNGGFETGDLTGWNLQSADGYTQVSSDSNFVSSGSYGLYAGQVGSNAILSQNIHTVAGISYTFSFDEMNLFGGATNEFQVFWDNTLILDFSNSPASAFEHFMYTLVATDSSTEIKFGLRHDPSFLGLDNISVNPVPVPAAVWLFGSAIAGLMGVRRKKTLGTHLTA